MHDHLFNDADSKAEVIYLQMRWLVMRMMLKEVVVASFKVLYECLFEELRKATKILSWQPVSEPIRTWDLQNMKQKLSIISCCRYHARRLD